MDLVIEKFRNILKHLDFWMLELIFLSIFSKTILNINIYSHQIVAMILTVFPLLLKIATIILSFFEDTKKIKDTNLEIPYVEHSWLIPSGIIIYSCLILLKAYINTKIKWYMDIKYVSSHKLLFLYGIIGTLLYLIICTISTFNECEKEDNSSKNIVDYFCDVAKNETTIKYYLANYKIYFTSFTNTDALNEILAVSLRAASFFFYKYFRLMIIKNLSPIHLMFIIPPFFLIKKIILIAYASISEDKDKIKFYNLEIFRVKFILDSTGDIFSLFQILYI